MDSLRREQVQVDEYCVECAKESTFRSKRNTGTGTPVDSSWMFKDAVFNVVLYCTRADHSYVWFFSLKKMRLQKVGQVPSIEDIGRSELRKYQKILGGGHFAELKRATGLVSHGIGIGSCVISPRIFESLIEKHKAEYESQNGAIPDYYKLRMEDRIQALSSVLPPSLVKNKRAYSILSKGIHELDEDTCLKHFSVLLSAILQILEQDYQEEERRRLAQQLELEISKINSELGNASVDAVEPK